MNNAALFKNYGRGTYQNKKKWNADAFKIPTYIL
jgi:hypothetical protein